MSDAHIDNSPVNPAKPAKSMSIIVTKGTLDWAYPPFILATTAAAMGMNVSMFFTFYGLPLLLKDLDLKLSPLGNPAMKMPLAGMHMGMPNMASMIPGVDAAASTMMKNLMNKKGIASIQELRELALDRASDHAVLEAGHFEDRDVHRPAQAFHLRNRDGEILGHFLALGLVRGKLHVAFRRLRGVKRDGKMGG